ncbi:hypothetical protein PRZ48_004956 [Zasmidium cellare]|uniref:TEA domain-containing protein n=1 Tax=Zasmidium cellare TaxID=395010 RepID=A0ABR0ES36_ZASCE|nr:hypothetical protein PRZ48_004956 [Zasmidium cellare]
MIQPAPVLPSNGSPLLNADTGRSSRALQEQSNNRQHNEYYAEPQEQKYASLLTENNYPGHHQQPQPQHIYRQTPLQRNQYRHSSSRYHQLGHDTHDARARAKHIASQLYERFRASDQYMKYRNRQQKDDKNGEGQKWPDHLEWAFFQALVYWRPMGRRQIPHKDKRRGRNELIADYIEELTGEARTRKQVSSHIQVLKPFVEGDPVIMKFLSKEDMGHMGHPGRMYGGRAASYHGSVGRVASCYPATAPVQRVPAAPVAPMASSHELAKVKGYLAVFEPTDFQMFVQRELPDGNIERLHDYTHAISNPRQDDEKPEDMAAFSQAHPLTALLLSQRRPDCNIVLAEASLAFPTIEFKDAKTGKTLPKIRLAISFLCKSRYLDMNADVSCRNTFYKNGELLVDYNTTTKVDIFSSDDGSAGVEAQLKFGSEFWAKQCQWMAARLRDSEDPDRAVEEVKDSIKNITAMQEVFINTEQGPERLLVIVWSFRLSRDVRGKAYWRRLRLPSSPSTYDYQPRTERVDSVYDYGLDFTTTTTSLPQPALQSPFEYDTSSAGTWPTNLDDTTAPHSAIDFPGATDNAFDFSGGNINISYTDPSIMDFSNFDSSAFNFDATTTDFVADPALGDYTQPTETQESLGQDAAQEYSQQTDYSSQWCDSYTAFDSQPSISAGASNYATGGDSQSQVLDSYTGHYDHGYSEGPSDGQAYGGAGQDVHGREEDPLVALADASYLRGVSLPAQEGHHGHEVHQTS